MVKKSAKTSDEKICVKQVRSSTGCDDRQIQCLKGLGLGKIGKESSLLDNACTRGLINKVSHLVTVKTCSKVEG